MLSLRSLGIQPEVHFSDSEKHVEFSIPETLKYFEGHFPGQPVLPAFAIIEISQLLGSELNLFSSKIKSIPNAKFLSALGPTSKVKVNIIPYPNALDFTWFVLEPSTEWKKLAKLVLQFKITELQLNSGVQLGFFRN